PGLWGRALPSKSLLCPAPVPWSGCVPVLLCREGSKHSLILTHPVRSGNVNPQGPGTGTTPKNIRLLAAERLSTKDTAIAVRGGFGRAWARPAQGGFIVMLHLHGPGARLCDGISRREFLRAGGLGLAGLTLPALLQARDRPARPPGGKAKSCIQLFMW